MRGQPLRGIFVVGCPRSGTTLLQSMLGAQPQITCFHETNFLANMCGRLRKTRWYYIKSRPEELLIEFLAHHVEHAVRYVEAAAAFRDIRRYSFKAPALVAARFLDILDGVTHNRGCSIWLEKSPVHAWYLPLVDRADASKKVAIVHIVRDGRATVASLYNASKTWPDGPYGINDCIKLWNSYVRVSLHRIRSRCPRDALIFYDELTRAPAQALRELCRDIGLGWDERMLTDYGETALSFGALAKTQHANLAGPIRFSDGFERTFTKHQQDYIARHLRLDLFGELQQARLLRRQRGASTDKHRSRL